MNTAVIILLKQELITVENQIKELGNKAKSKKIFLISGIVSLLLTFIFFIAGSDGEGTDWLPFIFFLFAIGAIVFFILAFAGKKNINHKLAKAKLRNEEIKKELVKLEYS